MADAVVAWDWSSVHRWTTRTALWALDSGSSPAGRCQPRTVRLKKNGMHSTSAGGLWDVSHMGKLVAQGHDLLSGLRTMFGVETLEPGSVHLLEEGRRYDGKNRDAHRRRGDRARVRRKCDRSHQRAGREGVGRLRSRYRRDFSACRPACAGTPEPQNAIQGC